MINSGLSSKKGDLLEKIVEQLCSSIKEKEQEKEIKK